MADSPGHRIGQIIGYALELSVRPLLIEVSRAHSLYLDAIGPRLARNGRKKITWVDHTGNKHDLDFVLEQNGDPHNVGVPVAFVEVAWRRYTKHSVNKAGEIANALVPLRQTYSAARPFTGAVLAGVWTAGGLQHMTSQGIAVLHVPLETIQDAFAAHGMDIDFDEHTPREYQKRQVELWEAMSAGDQAALASSLISRESERYEEFRQRLEEHIARKVTRVLVLSLLGRRYSFDSPEDAIFGIEGGFDGAVTSGDVERLEIQVRYSNGDRIEASFENQADAVLFLRDRF